MTDVTKPTTHGKGSGENNDHEPHAYYVRFADTLATLLEHPSTPQEVIDYIGGQIDELSTSLQVLTTTPAVLRAAFPVMCERLSDANTIINLLKSGIESAVDGDKEYSALMQHVDEAREQRATTTTQKTLADQPLATRPHHSQPASPAHDADPPARADYERLIESMSFMFDLESRRQPQRLDIESPNTDDDDHLLSRALDTHIRILCRQIDFFEPDGQKLYVEMRLVLDRQLAKRARGGKDYDYEQSAVESEISR